LGTNAIGAAANFVTSEDRDARYGLVNIKMAVAIRIYVDFMKQLICMHTTIGSKII
jgi:hypothetical protein